MAKLKTDTTIATSKVFYQNSLASYQEIGGSDNAVLRYLTVSSNGSVIWADAPASLKVSYLDIDPPYYAITPNVSSIFRANTVSFTISSASSPDTLYWTLRPLSGSILDSDFTSPANVVSLGGNVSIANNIGSLSLTSSPTANFNAFYLELRANSTSGPIANISPAVAIVRDDYFIESNTSLVVESQNVLINISSQIVNSGTLYWTIATISGNITDTDFTSPVNAVSNGGGVTLSGGTGSFILSVNRDEAAEGIESFKVQLRANSTAGAVLAETFSIDLSDPPANSVSFTSPGTYSWTCPPDVYSVSVVCIGGGGSGNSSSSQPVQAGQVSGTHANGGGGGGLGWKNNIAVTPGQSYTVVVGAGGAAATTPTNGGRTNGNPGGNSYFISNSTVSGEGGRGATNVVTVLGGTFTGDGGGNGGAATGFGSYGGCQGGGGAGGYSGNGGNSAFGVGYAGTGGGASAGTGEAFAFMEDTGATGYGGGGVGIQGQGSSGTEVSGASGGIGGSSGSNGSFSGGGSYGGGAPGRVTVYNSPQSGFAGAGGAVRIIWGQGRSFPSTNTSTSYDVG